MREVKFRGEEGSEEKRRQDKGSGEKSKRSEE
jgi:hypothetical protein